jgi:ribosomal protein L37E
MTDDDSTSAEDEPKLAHGTEPDTALCQRCGAEFEWTSDSCPECGWDKSAWVSDGRYGLGGS